MRLSLLAIMQDEAPLVARWLAGATRIPGMFDEIVVIDGGSVDGTVAALESAGGVRRVVQRPFPGDFADQRNFAVDQCDADWIFDLDADEIPSVPLLAGLRAIAESAEASNVDRIGIPRLNFHDNVLQQGPGHRGLDYQYRLYRKHCRWAGNPHSEVTGHQARIELDIGDGHFIQHLKTAARHAERNALYARMGVS